MKNSRIIAGLLIIGMGIYACSSNKAGQTTNNGEMMAASETTSGAEVWEEGLSVITGTISSVETNKDGQTLVLYNNKGIKYTAVVSTANLGDNAFQYRTFKIGENVAFKGNLLDNQRVIVREILAMD